MRVGFRPFHSTIRSNRDVAASPSKKSVLIPLTDEEHRNALELFATETPEVPQPRRAEAPAVDVSDITFEHAPLQLEEPGSKTVDVAGTTPGSHRDRGGHALVS